MRRGEVWLADFPAPVKKRPVVLVARDQAYAILESFAAAIVTSTVRDIPCEVPLGPDEGLRRTSVVNTDNIHTIPKSRLIKRLGFLGPGKRRQLDDAIRFSLELE